MMVTRDFRTLKPGEQVKDAQFGWGVVYEVYADDKPGVEVTVNFSGLLQKYVSGERLSIHD